MNKVSGRKIYLLSGIMGQGKDYFLRENNLDMFSVSMDEIRKLNTTPFLNIHGELETNNTKNTMIFEKFKEVVKNKMLEGGLIILNNMHLDSASIKGIKDLANKMFYDIAIVDFPLKELDFYLERNKQRKPFDRVEEAGIIKAYNKKKSRKLDESIEVLTPDEFLSYVNKDYTNEIIDVNQYKRIHFFGDLQGCAQNMIDYVYKNGGKGELFVFAGDYFDRGNENGKIAQFLNMTKDMSNFIFIRGNHDENIYRYFVQNNFAKLPISSVFTDRTLPEIEKVGLKDKKVLMSIYDKMKDYVFLKYHDKIIFVNHAGLSTVPKYPHLISRYIYQNGDSGFSFDVDAAFSKNKEYEQFIQVHGHRNDLSIPVITKNSVNLEGGIEYGQHLRILEINKEQGKINMNPIEIKNNHYIRGMLKFGECELEFNPVANLQYDKTVNVKNNLELIEALRAEPLIYEVKSETYPHISSFNFTKTAFYEANENHFDNEIISHSRGLFINTETGEIVGRGFEKFFNLNEKKETLLENIGDNYKFPLKLFKKENGYFTMIGYDEKTDELIYMSKSRIDGDYPEYTKMIASQMFNENELNKLKRYAQKYNVNYIFEGIDMKNDPHIVEYDSNKLVLLSIVKRDLAFQDVTYESLVKFSNSFRNLECKELSISIKNEQALKGFCSNIAETNKFLHEGFVAEDREGKKFKIKTPFYSGWKIVRGAIENYNRRHLKLTKQLDQQSRESVRASILREREALHKKAISRLKSSIENFNIRNEELASQLMDFFVDEIKEPNPNFNSTYFYEKRNDYLKNLELNKEVAHKKENVSPEKPQGKVKFRM